MRQNLLALTSRTNGQNLLKKYIMLVPDMKFCRLVFAENHARDGSAMLLFFFFFVFLAIALSEELMREFYETSGLDKS